jgi:hypothetical protein
VSGPTEIPPSSTAPAVPGVADRYGAERPALRRLGIAIGSVLVAALLGWAVWAALGTGSSGVEADVSSYDVVSSHEVRVKVAVHSRDPDTDGTCLLRATAEDHTVVGELNLTADELRKASGTWIPIRTERRATTAALVRCTG